MKEDKEIIEETIKIPADMAVDVLAIIVKEKLKNEIIEVIENRSIIVLALSYDKSLTRHQNILHDIRSMIDDYNNFRTEEVEKINWR